MNDRGNDIVPPADGTCTWLPEHPIYTDWISQRRGLLWIKGKPGVGKSTLLKYGLLTLLTMEPPLRKPLNISFFFHGRGAEIQKTPLGLYRSLLYQLLERFPKALCHVVQTFKSNCAGKGMPGERWNWHVQELRDFFESSLTKILEGSAIRIFVDALDECGEEEARRLVRYFERLFSKTYFAPHGLSICFSCRHWPVIAPDDCQEICAEHENHADVRTYIQEKLRSVVLDYKARDTLQGGIEARSECVFQWVVLVMPRIVEMCKDGKTLRQCLEGLKEIPQDLDDLYEDIIQCLIKKDRGRSMKLFQWICFAHRPLSRAELRCAMNVDANLAYQSFQEWQKLPAYIEADTQMEKQLRSLSGGLAEWKKHERRSVVAQLVHQSVNDYLITKGFSRLDISLDSVDKILGCSQSRLSRSCIVYFVMDEIKRRLRDCQRHEDFRLPLRGEHLRAEYPFLEYTSESWLPHAQAAEEQGMVQEDIFQYLQRDEAWTMPYWVELCQKIGTAGIFSTGTTGWVELFYKFGTDGIFSTGTTILHVASAFNLISLVSVILNSCERFDVDVNSKDKQRQTPLLLAAKMGHEAVVELLLAQPNVDINTKSLEGETPLAWAARSGHESVIKLLLAQPDVKINSKNKKWGLTPLSWAAERGHEGVVKLLLARPDVKINSKDKEWGRTPLSWAVKSGHEGVVKLLLAQPDIEINPRDKQWGQTPLSWAVKSGHEGVVKLLLSHPDIDVNSKDRWGRPPLSWAAQKGHETVIKLLIAQPNVDVNSRDRWGYTPLSCAATEGHETVVKVLLAHPDIGINSKDTMCQTPLSWAAWNGSQAVVKLLLAQPDIDVNSKDKYGQTPLLWAAWNGSQAVVKLLLAQPDIDVNSKDKYGHTPLSLAAANGHEGAIKLLLAQINVDTDSTNEWAQTLLCLVAENGHEAAIKLLLSQPKGAAESKHRRDQLLVSLAAMGGHASVIKLLAANPDIDVALKDEAGVMLLTFRAKIALRLVGRKLRSKCARS